MNKTFSMDRPVPEDRLGEMVQGLVGKPLDRPDGPLKVTGTATYAHEWNLPGTAYGVFARAPFARGTITAFATDRIEAMEGILRVITDARLLRNPAQGTANKAPVQGPRDVHYLGQPVALVVAETFEAARHGAQNLEMSWEVSDVVFDAEDTDTEDGETLDQGDLDAAMQDAHVTVDARYRTPGHSSAAMEPHCAVASWDGDDLTLHGSYQMLNYNINELADALGIDVRHVHMRAPFVGGGFGSKLGISPEAVGAAIAARERPAPSLSRCRARRCSRQRCDGPKPCNACACARMRMVA